MSDGPFFIWLSQVCRRVFLRFLLTEYGKKEEIYMENSITKKQVLKKTLISDLRATTRLRVIVAAALLAAMSFILGKFLQIPIGEIIRISFENLPLMMAGICFGPLVGAMTGAVADLVGCLLYGYAINPLITLGAATVGVVSGVVSHYLVRKPLALSVGLSVLFSHLIGSVVVKSFGLAAWYLTKYEMGILELMGWRLLVYTFIGIAEFIVIYLLMRSRAFCSQLERLVGKK